MEEVREADILLHVIDISHPSFEEQIDIVQQTLVDLNAADKPTIMVFNKIDQFKTIQMHKYDISNEDAVLTLESLEQTWMAKNNFPCVFISASTNQHINELRTRLLAMIGKLKS